MKTSTLQLLANAGALVANAGALVGGALLTKVVLDKFPGAKPVVVWASGAHVGVGVTLLAAPITKSEAASILATPDADAE